MVTRETNQEKTTTRLLEKAGYESRKDGRCGYPDRFVLVGHSRHCWIEHKTDRGRLTAAQKRVIPRLEARGDVVIYAKGMTPAQILDAVVRFWRT